jgi:excisionase family DNA binding protein
VTEIDISAVVVEIRDLLRQLVLRELRLPRLLRVKEAAVYLRKSPAEVRRLVQAGELPIIKGNAHGPWLLDRASLDSWVQRNQASL